MNKMNSDKKKFKIKTQTINFNNLTNNRLAYYSNIILEKSMMVYDYGIKDFIMLDSARNIQEIDSLNTDMFL
jgi:hypothetical protein